MTNAGQSQSPGEPRISSEASNRRRNPRIRGFTRSPWPPRRRARRSDAVDGVALDPHPLVRAGVGFACAGGSASHGQWPQQASFRSVVVGILGNGHQLDRIYSTWLPELWQGHVYLMVDACEHATTSLSMHRRNTKTHAARDGPVIQLVRHHTPTILTRSKTQADQMPPAVAGLLRVAEGPHRSRHALRRCGRALAAVAAAKPN